MFTTLGSLSLLAIGCFIASVCIVGVLSALYAIYKEINRGGFYG